ncbi:MAG: MBL fold metallo-hydrolase [Deltaproteobacteria bacterium]|nr:MBL fold metallo-hydrolase [Deltaproteobacteria bacterium]
MADNDRLFDFSQGPVKLIRGNGYPFCHALLVEGGARAIVDPACDPAKIQALCKEVSVDYLLNSHAHEDHLGGNHLFPEAIMLAHPDEAPLLADIECWLSSLGGDGWPEEDKALWRSFLIETCHYVPRAADGALRDGDVLDLGGVGVEIVHTPGHTSGHCAFYVPEEKILYTADLDLSRFGPYYGDPSSDIDDTIRSLERLKTYDARTYLTAHGRGVYEGRPEVIDRYLESIYLREEKLLAFLADGPKTLEQIALERIVYGEHAITGGPWDLLITERGMMAKHLERLIARGGVKRRGDFFSRVY